MAKKFYDRPHTVTFTATERYMKAEINITPPNVTFVAPSWEDLRDYFRKLVNPASRI